MSDGSPDAFDGYRQSLADLYDVTDSAAVAVGFSSRTKAFGFGNSSLGWGRSVAQTLTRGPDQIVRSGIDHISLIINRSGTVGDCDGRTVDAAAGAVQFRDMSRPSASRVDGIDTLHLMVPRTSLPSWMPGRGLHGLVLPPTSAGARLVTSHLQTLFDVAPDLTEDEGIAAIEATFVIAERFMGKPGMLTPPQMEAVYRTLRQRAVRFIDTQLSLGPVETIRIARALGVSRSSLYRAFEATGGVQACILGRRLDRVYLALRLYHGTPSSLADIAEQYGFTNEAAFIRVFRDRFGFRPDGVPRWVPAGAGSLSKVQGVYDGAAHEVVLDWLRSPAASRERLSGPEIRLAGAVNSSSGRRIPVSGAASQDWDAASYLPPTIAASYPKIND